MIDPSELIKGLCVCVGLDYRDVSRITIQIDRIAFDTWATDGFGKKTGEKVTRVFPWRMKNA